MKQTIRSFMVLIWCLILLSCGESKDSNQLTENAYSTHSQTNEVYITPHGKRYHHDWCRTIQGHSVTGITIEDAEERGRTPCHVCY